MSARPGRTKQSGFTLLEVLLAVMIVGMLSTIVGMSLQIVVDTWERGERRVENIERTRYLIEFLAQDIRSAFAYRSRTENSNVSVFFGDKDRINLVTTSPMLSANLQSTGLREVSYWSDPGKGLVLREAPLLHTELYSDERGTELIVSPIVKRVEFEYLYQWYSRVTGELVNEWSESWGSVEELGELTGIRASLSFMDETIRSHSIRNLPAAVRVTLSIEIEKSDGQTEQVKLEPVVIPVMAAQIYEAKRQ